MEKEVHVVLAAPDRGWDVKTSSNGKVIKHFLSKDDAVLYARQLNIHIGGKLIIHTDHSDEEWIKEKSG